MKNALYFFLFLFFLSCTSFAQNGQDKEHTKTQTIEEIFLKEQGNKARAIMNKEKYLIVENLRNGKAFRYYIGDEIAFKTVDNFHFKDQLTAITDSTFQISTYNESTNRMELYSVKVKDVMVIYTAPKKSLFPATVLAAPVFFGLDWVVYKQFPKDRIPLFIALAVIPVGWNAIKNIARVKNVKKKYQLKVFQAY